MALRTHYDTLGVSPDARPAEIARAHERLVAEFALDTTPPDPRREALIAEAFAVLSDPGRRAGYDRSLATQEARPAPPDRRKAIAIGAVAAVVVAALGTWFLAGGSPAPAVAGRPVAEIQAEAARSVGRMRAVEMSGKVVANGIAFAVAKGLMATSCEGLAPGTQVVVTIGTREVAARIDSVDEALGLCRLAVDGAGSWPLATGGAAPRAGDKLYAAGVNAAGEVELVPATVKRVFAEGGRTLVEASVAPAPDSGGRPLLDAGGKVVAAAIGAPSGKAAMHVAIPPGWATEMPAPAKP